MPDSIKEYNLKVIAHIRNDFPSKFGVPRQSNVVSELKGQIIFEPEYRNPDALRGIEGFDYLWLIWQFSEAVRDDWSPTVRPPILGGNTRVGVFATRSPFRPNALGLTNVRLESVEYDTPEGPILHISGADMMDGTPIFDIKPYVAYADSHAEAREGFTGKGKWHKLEVNFPAELLSKIKASKQQGLLGVLASDPRPHYHADPARIYGMPFDAWEIKFRVEGEMLHVVDVVERK